MIPVQHKYLKLWAVPGIYLYPLKLYLDKGHQKYMLSIFISGQI